MAGRSKRTFTEDFRRFFIRGLAILLPSVMTLWILVMAYRFVETNIGEPINQAVRFVILQTLPRVLDEENQFQPEWFVVTIEMIAKEDRLRREANLPELTERRLRTELRQRNFKHWWDQHWYLRLVGMGIAIILIYLVGVMLRGIIGRRIYAKAEEVFTRLPIFKQIYPSVKRVVEFAFGEEKVKFNRVVLLQYPRVGIWSLGLVTGPPMRIVQEASPDEMLTIFVPSSPTPFTGYTVTVRRDETVELGITVDEALRFTVSGGVLLPESQQGATGVSMLEAHHGGLRDDRPESSASDEDPPPGQEVQQDPA